MFNERWALTCEIQNDSTVELTIFYYFFFVPHDLNLKSGGCGM